MRSEGGREDQFTSRLSTGQGLNGDAFARQCHACLRSTHVHGLASEAWIRIRRAIVSSHVHLWIHRRVVDVREVPRSAWHRWLRHSVVVVHVLIGKSSGIETGIVFRVGRSSVSIRRVGGIVQLIVGAGR